MEEGLESAEDEETLFEDNNVSSILDLGLELVLRSL